jgi:hypothetical protein
MTVHFNVMGTLARRQHGSLFVGTIVEGPSHGTVTPVAEVFHEHDLGLTTTSGLIGDCRELSALAHQGRIE